MNDLKLEGILLLDDDPISLLLITKLIEDLNIAKKVISAESGFAALNLLEIYKPSLILVDIQMPVMDGFTFIQEVYKIKTIEGKFKIAAITAHLNFIEKQRFQAIGIEDFLLKPLNKEKILVLIKRYFDWV